MPIGRAILGWRHGRGIVGIPNPACPQWGSLRPPMPTTHLAPSADLPPWAGVLALALAVTSFGLLLVEMRRRERGGTTILATGVLALVALLAAVLRPVGSRRARAPSGRA